MGRGVNKDFRKAKTKCGVQALVHAGALSKPHRGCKQKGCRWGS